ncbi:FecCD family ABC transporter permease [Paenibacillus senegalimassiliensis]|uniref:FecCD family ABC transporter permease n=1 Tax=Paenibacillus senegalimassiliensis TaxID=1737426 RepID=UPI00073F3E29|nr:iron ABC transporter permease [Paenibacillus senegalimassiliensis]
MNAHKEILVRKRFRRAVAFSLIFSLVAVIVVLISLNTGSISLSPASVWQTMMGYGTNEEKMILFDYRLPRIIITMLAGIGLGVSGAAFQGTTRNALADPGILGINTGAALGLIIFVSFFRTMEGPLSLLIPIFTFAGGTLSAFIIFLFAYDRHRGILPIRLILVGIAVAAGISAVTLILSLKLDEETYSFAARWLAGSVWGRDWIHVWSLLPWVALLVPFIYSRSQTLDILSLGDEIAHSLGSHVTRERLLLLGTAVALTCASVSVAGGIGFIGLVAPHIAKRLTGPQHRYFLPVAALIGLVILVTADTIGRSIFRPNAIPAGVVVALVGGPYFLYLLFKSKG